MIRRKAEVLKARYEKNLKDGVKKLRWVGFRRAEEGKRGKYWKVKEDENPRFRKMLSLKKVEPELPEPYIPYEITPSEAIDRMFGEGKFSKNREEWTFDCAQWIQVVLLYALRYTLGKTVFNIRIGRDFHLKQQMSSGIKRLVMWERKKPRDKIKKYEYSNNVLKSDSEEKQHSMDEILSFAPIGSRVSWTNLEYDENSTYRNQNAIKLGKNKFGSHYDQSMGVNVYSRQYFEGTSSTKENKENPFISQIEIYDAP